MKIIRRLLAGLLVIISCMGLQSYGYAQQTETKQPTYDEPKTLDPDKEETVIYNTQSRKYHDPDCTWAKRCTKNCVPMKRKEAIERGGVPCKVCGV